MKKLTAFLTLLGLLAMLGGLIYAFKNLPESLDPLVSAIANLIPDQHRSPVLIGVSLFWLCAFISSVYGLFSGAPVVEKPIEPKPIEMPVKDKPETVLKSEFVLLENELEKARSRVGDLEGEVGSLQSQLQKFVVTDEEKNEKARLEARIKEMTLELENQKKSGASADEALRKAQGEAENLKGRVGKLEEEIKTAGREKEKVSTELKNSRAESEKFKQRFETLKEENDKIKAELQSAIADARGGKNGIPPAAYQILYLFQKEGRLIDLLMEDVSEFDDETLGGAIRPIHEGCRKILKERLIIEPVLSESEGSEITIDEADPEAIKLSGNVPSKGPYKGVLVHRGWRLKECNLPELVGGWSGNVVAPAEIEIS